VSGRVRVWRRADTHVVVDTYVVVNLGNTDHYLTREEAFDLLTELRTVLAREFLGEPAPDRGEQGGEG
jgi:hypothetical protein